MTIKILGAVLVVFSCGGFGYMITKRLRNESDALLQLIHGLEFMECELAFRMTPLPQLFHMTASVTTGYMHDVFLSIAHEMQSSSKTDAYQCITSAIEKCHDIPPVTRMRICELAHSMGTFDLTGQLRCIQASIVENKQVHEQFKRDQISQLRSYKTLCLSAGAALVILFI